MTPKKQAQESLMATPEYSGQEIFENKDMGETTGKYGFLSFKHDDRVVSVAYAR